MISANMFRFLAAASTLSLGALAAPAEAAVFEASATVSANGPVPGQFTQIPFSLPKYPGPGTIVGVNIALSGSASATDLYPYNTDFGITVDSYSSPWALILIGPSNPSVPMLEASATGEYVGGSVPPCEPLPECGGKLEHFVADAGPTAFSGNVDVSDFSDFAGSGSNTFQFVPAIDGAGVAGFFTASATVTETILAVPEPSTWGMAFIGFAIVGFAAHGRRLVRRLTAYC